MLELGGKHWVYWESILFPHAGSGTSKKLAKRNAAAKMLLRVHTVPLDARDGNEAEPDDDHFSIVSGSCGPGTVVRLPWQGKPLGT